MDWLTDMVYQSCATCDKTGIAEQTTLEWDRSWRMPGVTRPQKSMTVWCALTYDSVLVKLRAASDSQYIVHSCPPQCYVTNIQQLSPYQHTASLFTDWCLPNCCQLILCSNISTQIKQRSAVERPTTWSSSSMSIISWAPEFSSLYTMMGANLI